MTGEPECYYREVDARTANGRPCISLRILHVAKRTPKGVWVAYPWDREGYRKKFVLHDAHRKYAYPTREQARASYIIRKKREIQHCAAQHDKAVELLAYAKAGAPPMPEYMQFEVVGQKPHNGFNLPWESVT